MLSRPSLFSSLFRVPFGSLFPNYPKSAACRKSETVFPMGNILQIKLFSNWKSASQLRKSSPYWNTSWPAKRLLHGIEKNSPIPAYCSQ